VIRNLIEKHLLAAHEALRAHLPECCGWRGLPRRRTGFQDQLRAPTLRLDPQGAVLFEMDLEKGQSRAAIGTALMEALRKTSLAALSGARAREP
jgi:hypothetical protein